MHLFLAFTSRAFYILRIKAFGWAMAFCLAATSWGPGLSWSSEAPVFIELVGQHIRERIKDNKNPAALICRGEPLSGFRLLPLFYEERRFFPVWLDAAGLRPITQALIRTIEQADQEGLQPSDYHLDPIAAMLADMESGALMTTAGRAALWSDLDVLLTDAFLLLSAHLSGGRVNPESLHKDWVLSEKTIDILKVLHTAVTEAQIDQVIERLSPGHAGYANLRTALRQLRGVVEKGGWPRIPDGPTLQPGDRDARVLTLRDRLKIGGDLEGEALSEAAPEHFDAPLEAAVKRFQSRHGLEPDGLVGRATLVELNIPARERARQIELNLERWRWLPHDLGKRYIEVNTADFSLSAVEDHQIVMRMRVVVGRPARRTPVFSARMAYMVINPYWTVPFTIAVEDILPKLVEDVSYLEQQSLKVYYGWDDSAPAIDPRHIDWRAYGRNHFPFRLVQAPGAHNSLGQMKFMFPNRFSVYLHDTPNRALFGKVQRDFSSGCIRVEDAPSLAAFLLKADPDWSVERLQTVLKTSRQHVIRIKDPVPVHLLYMTAWVDADGEVQFRKDIYKRDRALDVGLKRKPQTLTYSLEAALPQVVR